MFQNQNQFGGGNVSICKFWSMGKCWRGAACTQVHAGPGACEQRPSFGGFNQMSMPNVQNMNQSALANQMSMGGLQQQMPAVGGFSGQQTMANQANMMAMQQNGGVQTAQGAPNTASGFVQISADAANIGVQKYMQDPGRWRLVAVEHEVHEEVEKLSAFMCANSTYKGAKADLATIKKVLDAVVGDLETAGWVLDPADDRGKKQPENELDGLKSMLGDLVKELKAGRASDASTASSGEAEYGMNKRARTSVGGGAGIRLSAMPSEISLPSQDEDFLSPDAESDNFDDDLMELELDLLTEEDLNKRALVAVVADHVRDFSGWNRNPPGWSQGAISNPEGTIPHFVMSPTQEWVEPKDTIPEAVEVTFKELEGIPDITDVNKSGYNLRPRRG
jgi:hypothetical protein